MKNNRGFIGLGLILAIIAVLIVIVFFFPKNCGYWRSWGMPSDTCNCVGFKYTPGGYYDSGPHLCFGIKK